MQTVEKKFHLSDEFIRRWRSPCYREKKSFLPKRRKKKDGRGRREGVENGGTRFQRVEIFILRKLVEWKSFPLWNILMDYHL